MVEACIPGTEGSEFIPESMKVVMNKDLDVWSSKKEVPMMKMARKYDIAAILKPEDAMDTVSRCGATKHTMATGKPMLFMEEVNSHGTVLVQAIRVTFEPVATMEWEVISTPRVENMLVSGIKAEKMELEYSAGRTEPCTAVYTGVENVMDTGAWSMLTEAYTKVVGRKDDVMDLGSTSHRMVESSTAAYGVIISPCLCPNFL
jgi:hypothetical protein